jgi:RNA polymerase sigma factor (sigma-70 family)
VSDPGRERLRELFIASQGSLRTRLRRRLGSEELAEETLQEIWIRLSQDGQPIIFQRAESYLFGMALNVAASLRRSEARHATRAEIEAALEFADETARPDEAAEARIDLEALERAILELPPRRRAMLLAVRVNGASTQEVAESYGLTRRSVEAELKRALEYCATRLGRSVIKRFGPKPSKTVKD